MSSCMPENVCLKENTIIFCSANPKISLWKHWSNLKLEIMPVAWVAPLQLQRLDCVCAKHSAISNPFEESSHSGFTHRMGILYITAGLASSTWGWIGFFEYFPLVAHREFLSVFSWTPQLPRDRDWKLFVTLLSLCPLTAYCYSCTLERYTTDSWRVWLMNHQIGFLWVQDSSLFL